MNPTGDMAHNPRRVWVGPIMLVFLITFVYLFSVVPQPRPTLSFDAMEHDEYVERQRMARLELAQREEKEHQEHLALSAPCHGNGYRNATNQCACKRMWSGETCETPACIHGFLSSSSNKCICGSGWAGVHCEVQCRGGSIGGGTAVANNETNTCECEGQWFGHNCGLLCEKGLVDNGRCECMLGYGGLRCERCVVGYSFSEAGNCMPSRRQPINTRLTLSGLSFCLILIGLLCITASRRRAMIQHEMNWVRQQQTQYQQAAACPYVMRNDRGHIRIFTPFLFISPQRATSVDTSLTAPMRPATPPPTYTAVENTPRDARPPTYEEATTNELVTAAAAAPPAEDVKEEDDVVVPPTTSEPLTPGQDGENKRD